MVSTTAWFLLRFSWGFAYGGWVIENGLMDLANRRVEEFEKLSDSGLGAGDVEIGSDLILAPHRILAIELVHQCLAIGKFALPIG